MPLSRTTDLVNPRTRARLVIFFIVGMRTCVAGDCRSPSYREGFVWEDSASSIMMNISIPMNDFAPARLVCLAEAMKQRYSDRRKISIFMFNSYASAKHYTHPFSGDSFQRRVNWSLQMHASYSFDDGKGEDAVFLMPFGDPEPYFTFGDREPSFNTRIDLPVTSMPSCTLERSGRCLLALDSVDYPWDALTAGVSGTVTLEGVIGRDGRVRHVRSVGLEAHPSGAKSHLSDAALRNLKTWRFEAAGDEVPIQITYSYVLEAPGSPVCQTGLRFALPDRVEIKGRPRK